MEKSRIPVRVRKDSAGVDKAPPASSSSTSLPGNSFPEQTADERSLPGHPLPSSAERSAPVDRRIRPGSTSRPLPRPSSAEKPTGKRRPPGRSSYSVTGFSSAVQHTHMRILPRLQSLSLPGSSPAGQSTDRRSTSGSLEYSSTKKSTNERISPRPSVPYLFGPAQFSFATDRSPSGEQSRKARTDGRPTGHNFANNVAKDNSRIHYGDNYSGTHHHNYRGPDPDNEMPRSLKEAITKNRVETYLNHVMKSLSFERMGLRKGTIVPALDNTCQWLLVSPEYISWRNPNLVQDHHGFMSCGSRARLGLASRV